MVVSDDLIMHGDNEESVRCAARAGNLGCPSLLSLTLSQTPVLASAV